MRRLVTLVVVAPLAASASPAPPRNVATVEGSIVATHSRWTRDGSRIVTDATVRSAAGDVVVSQLGGTVDNLTMRTFPGPEPLAVGMQVAVGTHQAADLGHRMHVVADDVRVLAMPAGFVRTGPTKAGRYLYWESGCVYVTASPEGTRQVVGDNELEAIESTVAEWNTGIAGCSYMNIVLEQPTGDPLEVGRNNTNLIKFRDETWCRPAIDDDPMRCYSPNAAGLTTAVFVDDASSDRDGALVDADIELNGKDFATTYMGQSSGTADCGSEITNTLTHELGHLLGLEHPCLAGGDPPRTDGSGNPVPSCSTSMGDPRIVNATMYNFQSCDETEKASLSDDDIAGVCAIYPLADDPGTCAPVGDDGGCCSSSASPTQALVPALFVLGVLLLARRRRRTISS
ncbi:MAG: MYXO-CTERM sorting domain-containing protein [Kofleriaceae bacterium]